MNRLKKVILGLSIAFTMAIALVIGLVNMPKPTKLNNTPLNTLETNIEDKVYQVIDDGNTLNYEYDSTMQSAEDSTKVYSYHFKNIMNENMAVYMHELECEGLTFEYAVSNTEQTDTTSLTFSSTLSVEPLAPKGTTGSEVYVYVRVTPTSESVTYNCPIKWTFGHRQTITCYSDGEQVGEPVIGICNAATINEYNLPTITVADGYVLKWFSDPEQKKLTTFPLETSNEALQLYAIKAFVLSDSSWFQLNEDGQSYSVVKGNGKLTGAIIIPETYNNLPVIAIKSGTDYSSGVFFSQTSLTSIIIPASVISIGNYAFWGCFELMGVIIPNSLTNIGNEAFCACEKLISIDLSICINLTSIGENAFAFCDSLSRITIPKGVTSIGDCAFYECTGLTSVTFANNSKLTSIQWGTFSLCLALSSITIPSSVTSIEAHAFGYCDSLRSIIFEQEGIWYYGTEEQQEAMNGGTAYGIVAGTNYASVFVTEKIDYYWYKGEETYPEATLTDSSWFSLNDDGESYSVVKGNGELIGAIIIPGTYNELPVTNIEGDAFNGCTSLSSIIIPSSVTSIGDYAFESCTSLSSITIPSSVTSIGLSVFIACDSLTSIVVESGNTVYDSRNNCNAIIETTSNTLIIGCKSTVIPNTVTVIGEQSFAGYESLSSISIPRSVISIARSAFFQSTSLTSVSFEANSQLQSIGDSAFCHCSTLRSVDFGANSQLQSLGDFAFSSCTSLSSITIPASVTSIGDQAFSYCSGLTSLTFEQGGTWAYTSNNDYTGGTEYTIVAGTNYYTEFKSTYYGYYWYKVEETYPEATLTDSSWFELNADGLGYTVVKGDVSALPSDGVVVIPQTYGSNNLPVTSIGTYAFYECTGINTVTIPRNVYTIGENAFSDCTNLKRVEFEENSNLNSLEDYVFGFCNMLEYVFVPASVKYITKYAFWSASTNGIVFEEQTSWYQTTGSYPGTHITDITIPNYFVGSGGLYNTLAGGNYTDLYPEE